MLTSVKTYCNFFYHLKYSQIFRVIHVPGVPPLFIQRCQSVMFFTPVYIDHMMLTAHFLFRSASPATMGQIFKYWKYFELYSSEIICVFTWSSDDMRQMMDALTRTSPDICHGKIVWRWQEFLHSSSITSGNCRQMNFLPHMMINRDLNWNTSSFVAFYFWQLIILHEWVSSIKFRKATKPKINSLHKSTIKDYSWEKGGDSMALQINKVEFFRFNLH